VCEREDLVKKITTVATKSYLVFLRKNNLNKK